MRPRVGSSGSGSTSKRTSRYDPRPAAMNVAVQMYGYARRISMAPTGLPRSAATDRHGRLSPVDHPASHACPVQRRFVRTSQLFRFTLGCAQVPPVPRRSAIRFGSVTVPIASQKTDGMLGGRENDPPTIDIDHMHGRAGAERGRSDDLQRRLAALAPSLPPKPDVGDHDEVLEPGSDGAGLSVIQTGTRN